PHLGALTRPDLVDPTQQSGERPEYAEEGTLETYHATLPTDPVFTEEGVEDAEEGPQGMGSDYSGALWTHETPVGGSTIQPANDLSWSKKKKKEKKEQETKKSRKRVKAKKSAKQLPKKVSKKISKDKRAKQERKRAEQQAQQDERNLQMQQRQMDMREQAAERQERAREEREERAYQRKMEREREREERERRRQQPAPPQPGYAAPPPQVYGPAPAPQIYTPPPAQPMAPLSYCNDLPLTPPSYTPPMYAQPPVQEGPIPAPIGMAGAPPGILPQSDTSPYAYAPKAATPQTQPEEGAGVGPAEKKA
ncbi:hypothetical protein KIPB_011872, partial [Kipferlia bialata]